MHFKKKKKNGVSAHSTIRGTRLANPQQADDPAGVGAQDGHPDEADGGAGDREPPQDVSARVARCLLLLLWVRSVGTAVVV
jgi:hypothetical protein